MPPPVLSLTCGIFSGLPGLAQWRPMTPEEGLREMLATWPGRAPRWPIAWPHMAGSCQSGRRGGPELTDDPSDEPDAAWPVPGRIRRNGSGRVLAEVISYGPLSWISRPIPRSAWSMPGAASPMPTTGTRWPSCSPARRHKDSRWPA